VTVLVVARSGVPIVAGRRQEPGPPMGAQLDAAFQPPRRNQAPKLVVARDAPSCGRPYFNGGGPDSDEYVWSVTQGVLGLTSALPLMRLLRSA